MSICSYTKKLDPVEKKYREYLAEFNEYILNDMITDEERSQLADRIEAFEFECYDCGRKELGDKLAAMWHHVADGGANGHDTQ